MLLNYTRDHTCLWCGHKWTSQIQLTDNTPNLSGEATPWCQSCDTKDVMSEPAKPAIDNDMLMVIMDLIYACEDAADAIECNCGTPDCGGTCVHGMCVKAVEQAKAVLGQK